MKYIHELTDNEKISYIRGRLRDYSIGIYNNTLPSDALTKTKIIICKPGLYIKLSLNK